MRFVLLFAALLSTASALDLLRPPGHRPLENGAHAITGARLVISPGKELENATLLIRDGRINAVGTGLAIPPDARVHDLKDCTIYAGFIDAHVSMAKSTVRKTNGAQDNTPPVSALNDLTAGAGSGFLGTSSAADSRNVVSPQYRVAQDYSPDAKLLESMRAEGFTNANIVPGSGVLRGISTVVSLGSTDPDLAILRADTFHHIAIETPKGSEDGPVPYPSSLMGTIALIRQTLLDAQFQAADHAHFEKNSTKRPRPAYDAGLAALLPALQKREQVVFEPASPLMVDRAQRLATEFGLETILLATGQEWRRPDLLQEARVPFIVPVDYPEVPKMPTDDDWEATSLDLLRAWDHSPSNPAAIRREKREIALTTHGLPKKTAFRANVRLAIARGLSEPDAIAALTTVPARLCGLEDQLGTLEAGKLANLTIFEKGRAFDAESKVREVWIEGRQFLSPIRESKKAVAKPARDELTAAAAQQDRGPLITPDAVLVKNATLWTCGPQGTLSQADLLIVNGKIKAIGTGLAAPKDAHVIDLPGVHVSPGLIDCHSHSMIMGGVNEGTLPSSAMVRVADVVNSETETIHQQLAGGLTVANLLHGSANPIGGQNCVIKLREGASPEQLKLAGAPGGIKFALGENVKQANWGDAFRNRFPQSRMGVPAFHTNRFTAAQQYMKALDEAKKGGAPVRRDLELETIAEIIRGERLIHCHSYRQDEILAFLRVMESFKVRVGTLQHILEGYKVADEIAKHGAGASAFSDWWAYKMETYDAIPHAGSLMHQRGVLVSFNSDSSDHARRLNLEAAKAVKYGGTSEVEALKFVTLNPAKQLRIDKNVGSLEIGKDGDFVIWSGHPLDTRSICLQTWIEGKLYFEREAALKRAQARLAEHSALIEKARKLATDAPTDKADEKAQAKFFFRTLEQRQGHLCVDCCMDRELKWQN